MAGEAGTRVAFCRSPWQTLPRPPWPRAGQGREAGAWFPQASRQPALSMHLKRRRIHFRVVSRSGGEELGRAKQSISFSAEPYITDPPFPPDRMTYVIYHVGPSQTTGREAAAARCLLPTRLCRRSSAGWRGRGGRASTGRARTGQPAMLSGVWPGP